MIAANAKYICGAECGIAVVGTPSAGVEHWSSVQGTPTVVTSGPAVMRSTRCFRFNPTAANALLATTYATAIASPATTVARCYIYFATLPSAADCGILTNSNQLGVWWHNTSGTLRGSNGGANFAASGFTPVTGVWYRIDMKAVNDATRTVDFSVDGVAQTQMSVVSAAGSDTGIIIGVNGAATTDLYIDDLVVSGTSTDYPIGPGTVIGLYPNGDRTNTSSTAVDGTTGNRGHIYNAVGDFNKGASGAVSLAAQNVESTSWQSLAKPLSSSIATNWIADISGASAEHLVWTHDQLPANANAINGVMCVATSHSASATQNNSSLRVHEPSTGLVDDVWAVLDLSEITITIPCKVLPTAPSATSDPWTPANVNSTTFLFGDSTDVAPDPYLDGVCLEVDVVLYQPRVVQANQAVQRAAVR